MSHLIDGGPAFPVQDASKWQCHGMTLRDYFAAKAMHAEIVTSGADLESARALCQAADAAGRRIEDQMAFNAYEMADAMLRAREVNP